MKRFIFVLCALSALIVMAIVAVHVYVILACQREMDEVYAVRPDQDVLFLGSSQIGCAIEESSRFHNKCIWVSETIAQSCLIRLKELERRNQLSHVKILVVPFHVFMISAQSEWTFKWAWYQELAVSWRHLDMLPCGLVKFLAFIACNLRIPPAIHVSEKRPRRQGLTERPVPYQRHFHGLCEQKAAAMCKVSGSFRNWEQSFFGSYNEMKEICDRHGIRFVVCRAPVLPYFDHRIPECGQRMIDAAVTRIRSMGIEYIDTDHEIPEKYFFDWLHLIPDGATIFTEKLYRKLSLQYGEAVESEEVL